MIYRTSAIDTANICMCVLRFIWSGAGGGLEWEWPWLEGGLVRGTALPPYRAKAEQNSGPLSHRW